MFTVGQKELRHGLVSTRVRTSGSIDFASDPQDSPLLAHLSQACQNRPSRTDLHARHAYKLAPQQGLKIV